MFAWHLPGLGPHCFQHSALAGTSHISTQLTPPPTARLVGVHLDWGPKSPAWGNPTPLPDHRCQHPNAKAHPSGPPPPSRLTKEGSPKNSSHSTLPPPSNSRAHPDLYWSYEKYSWALETLKFLWFLKRADILFNLIWSNRRFLNWITVMFFLDFQFMKIFSLAMQTMVRSIFSVLHSYQWYSGHRVRTVREMVL